MACADKHDRRPKLPPCSQRSVRLSHVDVLVAVESLYSDRIKPSSHSLRRRIFEHFVAKHPHKNQSPVHIDMAQLHMVCAMCPAVFVQADGKGHWLALLVDRQTDFVDIYDSNDVYPATLWEELRIFCDGPAGDMLSLPGGRCACAQELRKYGPASLRERSLGEVCHIIELALVQKKILGYSNSNVVAYRYSQQKLKEDYAGLNLGMPCNGICSIDCKLTESVHVADLATSRKHLQQILEESDKPVPLPNIKRLFMSRFKLQLTETAFGHSKISDLLQDKRFSDICALEWNGNGFVVSPKPKRVINICEHVNHNFVSSPNANMFGISSTQHLEFCADELAGRHEEEAFVRRASSSGASGDDDASESPTAEWVFPDGYAGMIRGPFIHAKLPPPALWRGCRRRKRMATVPKDMGRDLIGSLEDSVSDCSDLARRESASSCSTTVSLRLSTSSCSTTANLAFDNDVGNH